jgi:hypothetical protein
VSKSLSSTHLAFEMNYGKFLQVHEKIGMISAAIKVTYMKKRGVLHTDQIKTCFAIQLMLRYINRRPPTGCMCPCYTDFCVYFFGGLEPLLMMPILY